MKNAISIICVTVVLGLNAQSILFDFNAASVPTTETWNVVDDHLAGVQVVNAVDAGGTATSVALNITNAFHFKGTGGSQPSPALGYDANACMDSFYLFSNGQRNAQFQFVGLTPGNFYDFVFFGSRATTGMRVMNVTIGSTTVSYNAVNNTSTTAVISNVVAPQSGIVTVNFSVASGSTYAHLSLIEIKGTFDEPAAEEEGLFVAPWGFDSNPGTKQFPFATIMGARDKVRQLKSSGLPDGGINIYIREGEYQFDSSMPLSAADSGSEGKPIVYAAYKGEQVVFSGGATLQPQWFEPLEDTSLFVLNLPQRGVSDFSSQQLHINHNRLTLVDSIGEVNGEGKYTVESSTGNLYLYPPQPFDGSEIIRYATLNDNMFTLYDASFLTFRGITLDTGGSNAIRCNMFFADLSTTNLQHNIRFESLVIRNFAAAAISLRGSNNAVENCHIHNIGSKAVNMYGGDIYTLEPGNNLVKNNRIHNVSNLSIGPGWGTAVDFAGVGQIMRNNLIYDTAPGLAATTIRGNDHLIEYNEFRGIFNAHSDDCGVIYFNFSAAPHYRGTVIRNNFFHNIGENTGRQCAVYVDWCTQDVIIEGNIFYRMSGEDQNTNWKAGIMSNASNYVSVTNNMFIDCSIPYRMSYWLSTWGTQQQLDFLIDKRAEAFATYDFANMAHATKYPALLEHEHKNQNDAWIYPFENTFKRNLIYNPNVNIRDQWYSPTDGYKLVSSSDISSAGPNPDTLWEGKNINNWAAQSDPGFFDFANADFRLEENAPIFSMIEGFEPIPFERIGLISPTDFNEDGVVDILDFAIISNYWLETDAAVGIAADIDGNGIVNISDLSTLLNTWLE